MNLQMVGYLADDSRERTENIHKKAWYLKYARNKTTYKILYPNGK